MSAFVKFYRNQRSWGILRSAQLASQYQETRQLCCCAAGRCGFVVTTDASCGNVAFLVSQSCIEQNRQQLAICLDAIFYKLPHLIHCWVLGDLCTSEHTRVVNDFWRTVVRLQSRFDVVHHCRLSVAKVTVRVHQVASVDHVDRKQVSGDVTAWHEGDLHWSAAHLNHSDQWFIGFVWQSKSIYKSKFKI